MDKKIYFTFLVVLLLAGGYWLFRCLNTEGCPTPKVTYPEVVYVGDDVWFTDSTEGATHRLWTLVGIKESEKDSTDRTSTESSIFYRYREPGEYEVTLRLTPECTETFIITVLEKKEEVIEPPKPPRSCEVEIIAPKKSTVQEVVTFKADVKDCDAEKFEWKFGESGRPVDATGKNVTYKFQQPSASAEVLLIVNDTSRFKTTIKIEPRPQPTGAPPVTAGQIESWFNQLVQNDGIMTDAGEEAYNLIVEATCYGETTAIIRNDETHKLQAFGYGVSTFGGGRISDVEINRNPSSGCITSISFSQ